MRRKKHIHGFKAIRLSLWFSGLMILMLAGPVFAQLHVHSRPAGAEVLINGRNRGITPLEVSDLAEGRHYVELRKQGYFSAWQNVTIEADRPTRLDIDLEARVANKEIDIVTRPDGGTIYLNGKKIGEGRVKLAPPLSGNVTLSGTLQKSPYERRSGKVIVNSDSVKTGSMNLLLDRRERLFEGNWLDEEAVRALEQERYQKQRVSYCVGQVMTIGGAERRQMHTGRFVRSLHDVLRVGDRIVFEQGRHKWLIWKRHHQITPEFRDAVAALAAGRLHKDDWIPDKPNAWRKPALHADILTAISLGLYANRERATLLDLHADQLSAQGETIWHNRADGPVTLVIVGGKGIALDKKAVSQVSPSLRIVQVSAADAPLELGWTTPPERLLAVCDTQEDRLVKPEVRSLRIREKNIVELFTGGPVCEMTRLTTGPDSPGWERRTTKPSGPLAGQIDLRRDEIGPHDTAGDYRRIWLLKMNAAGPATQRQVSVSYPVEPNIKDGTSDDFLRRPAGDPTRR